MRRHEIGGPDRGKVLQSFGNDLKDVIGFFLHRKKHNRAHSKDVAGGVILDHGMIVLCSL